MDDDGIITCLTNLRSPSVRRSMSRILACLAFIEDAMGGGDTYTAAKRTGKPESKEPGNVLAATHERAIEKQLSDVAHSTERSLRRIARTSTFRMEGLSDSIDARRDCHDFGERSPSRARIEAGVVRHLTKKYGKEEVQ